MSTVLNCFTSSSPRSDNLSKRSPEKRTPEKRTSLFVRLFGTTRAVDETPEKNACSYESDESDYLSGDDDDAFDLPDDDTISVERTYSLKKDNLVNESNSYSKKTYQALPKADVKRSLLGSRSFCGSPPASLLIAEQSPPNSIRSIGALQKTSKPGRTTSTFFDDELLMLADSDEEEENPFSPSESDSESEDNSPLRSQKRMLISFKEERERCVVWNTVSIESLPNTYVFNAGDVVYLDDGETVGTIVKMLDEGHNYRVQIRETDHIRDVSHTELEHCIKIIVKHPTEEQIEFFETCENAPNPNFLTTRSSSLRCPKKKSNLLKPPAA